MANIFLTDDNDSFAGFANGDIVYGLKGDDFAAVLPHISGITFYGGAGDDRFLYVGLGNSFFGGNGNDTGTVAGSGNYVSGGNGNDSFYAGNGHPGLPPTLPQIGTNNVLDGGNGDDLLRSDISNPSPGDLLNGDLLVGNANTLLGGNGKDILVSTGMYGSSTYGTDAYMSGGNGKDTFFFRQSSDNLLHDGSGLLPGDAVGEGQTVFGVFAVVTDYQSGEIVDIGTTTLDADGPQIGLINIEGHEHVVVDDDSYAFLRGELVSDGQFLVSDSGPDTLLIYDSDPAGEFFPEYSGSVVFLGVSDPSQITIGDSGHVLAFA